MAKDDISTRLEQLRVNPQPSADASAVATSYSADEELACALCYRFYPPTELTVASKERFNFEAAVVVCPNCLAQLQAEMKQRSANADIVLGLVWGVLATIVVLVPLGLTIWFSYQWPERDFWLWLGCYAAFLPGLLIGRAVYYGSGRKHSLIQQLIAVGLTLLTALTACYIAQLAAFNFQLDIIFKNGHPLDLIPPHVYLIDHFFDAIIHFRMSQLAMAGLMFGLLIGLVVAWFASAGPQLFTRPYLGPEPKTKKS